MKLSSVTVWENRSNNALMKALILLQPVDMYMQMLLICPERYQILAID